MDGITYYVAGDTDSTKENQSVACDVAIIPVGGTYTMNREKAAEYILQLAPKAAVPSHYGNVVGSPEDGEVFKSLIEAGNPNIQVELRMN